VEDNDVQVMLCSHTADLNEGRNKKLRVVCELEDTEGNDTGVQGLHFSTCLLKKGLKMADDFVHDLFQIGNFIDCA
jgi:hypothetical protein